MKKTLCALLTLGLATTGWAQAEHSWTDPEFREALQLCDQNNYPKAREIAEKMLAKDPKSYTATYVMGRVYYYGEGSIPRAYHCFKIARKELESIWADRGHIPSFGPWQVHSAILYQQIWAAGQLERYQEELDLIEEYNKCYDPHLDGLEGWPLLKLGRIEEAQKSLKAALDKSKSSGNVQQRGHILNTLGNIAFETARMQDAYDYFMMLCKEYEGQSSVDPVYWTNAGEAARDLLRYEKAEEHMLESTRRFSEFTYSDPWRFLAELYTAEGRLPEAVAALKEMQNWRLSCSPQVAQNKWGECLSTAGIVLMSLGYDDESLKIFDTLANRPDRNSGISTKPALMEARTLFFYAQALRANLQHLREEASWCTWRRWFALQFELLAQERQLTYVEGRCADLLVSHVGLAGFLPPYGANSLDHPWLAPAAWQIFGPGPVAATSRDLIANLNDEHKPEQPYLEAVLGEALAHKGDNAEAEKVLNRSLEFLPTSEVALRSRVQGLMARVTLAQGRSQESLHYLQRLMEVDPSILRHLELALPIQITSDGSGPANRAAGLLKHSPRFTAQSGAFVAQISSNGDTLHATLQSPDGTVLKTVDAPSGKSPEEALLAFCKAFHEEVFSPVIDLSQGDIYSINGSTQATSAKSLKDVLGK